MFSFYFENSITLCRIVYALYLKISRIFIEAQVKIILHIMQNRKLFCGSCNIRMTISFQKQFLL